MTMDIVLSVVIPTYNRETMLKKCIESLQEQDYPCDRYEIIVVDDGSSDNTPIYLQSISHFFSNLKYIRQNNLGHALSRRRGFQEAKGEIVASLDDDCIPAPNWIRTIVKRFQSEPNLSICCGRIINPTQTNIAWAQYLIDYSSWIGYREERNIRIVYTANTAYRRKVLGEGNWRSDGKYLGCRDIMFNYDIINKGFQAAFCPEMVVRHMRWEGPFDDSRQAKELFFRGQRRHGLGFRRDGFRAYDLLGRIALKAPIPLYMAVRASLLLYRAFRAGMVSQFLSSFHWIWQGLYHQALFIKRA